ncbi:MAG: DUF2891 domain-containing protein [Xanthomonadales bacterium]|nr:DUF2891 domain-containing protein [Gammaproteobacteria bacterium]NNK51751.1 DUF2891 domain-containing protein [Xanthomonadales bacterium]
MKNLLAFLALCTLLAPVSGMTQNSTANRVDPSLAKKFAGLALDCVHREYPNKISHVLNSAEDARTPSSLFPIFYGCFDWHSSVHGHWLLVRLLRTVPAEQLGIDLRGKIVAALNRSFSAEGIAAEVAYFKAENRSSFERPYGIAWFLQLTAELRAWPDPMATAWLEILGPLEIVIAEQIKSWLPNLAYPIRLGTHNQSMFAFGLILDWARVAGDTQMVELIQERSLAFHLNDRNCPMAYEPSGEDFLSPCLMEADLMRRMLPQTAFSEWLSRFLPEIPVDGSSDWLATGIVMDPTDGKLVHLDGVNLSRAWNLENIALALPENDPRQGSLLAAAKNHAEAGIANVSGEHYEGSHWLASFATYLVTRRGQVDP